MNRGDLKKITQQIALEEHFDVDVINLAILEWYKKLSRDLSFL